MEQYLKRYWGWLVLAFFVMQAYFAGIGAVTELMVILLSLFGAMCLFVIYVQSREP